jgi:Cof subfamily protein (haloacid dehalogenase superfamily)
MSPLALPAGFPLCVRALACDLDRTLIAEDAVLRPRTASAIAAARAAGLHVLLVTGRMFRSARRYALAAGITDPVVCYQGAVVADPVTGEFLRHVPMPEPEARDVITAVEALGYTILVYVDDELFVSRETPESDAYAGFQHLDVHVVADLLAWLPKAPTKLVVVGDPRELDGVEVEMKDRFGGRLYISKSLPHFLEFASPSVHKGSGLDFAAGRLGFSRGEAVAFGDGENDVELLEWAGFGVAVANAHPKVLAVADYVCPPVDEEGVAQVIEAYLATPA